MTREEFSNTFDTLLNSYGTQAQFGEASSKREVSLDEYEKSVILTQAQDIIVKSYFDATMNSQGQGFDDSVRRQVDFSSLIKTAVLHPLPAHTASYTWKNGNTTVGTIILVHHTTESITVIFNVTNESLEEEPLPGFKITYEEGVLNVTISPEEIADQYTENLQQAFDKINTYNVEASTAVKDLVEFRVTDGNIESALGTYTVIQGHIFTEGNYFPFDDRGVLYKLPQRKIEDTSEYITDVLFILNEKLKYGNNDYTIVPISYREYDREMSKAYAQPLKKQAWRLFQNIATGFDLYSELIPRWDLNMSSGNFEYRVRYVRRPQPIILEKLPDNLTVDGYKSPSDCELNPILHMDILHKAVEIAINTRIGTAPQQQQQSR